MQVWFDGNLSMFFKPIHQIFFVLPGTGSVLNAAGQIEMDAMIMSGKDLELGSIACVQDIRNPVSLARKVMEEVNELIYVHCV